MYVVSDLISVQAFPMKENIPEVLPAAEAKVSSVALQQLKRSASNDGESYAKKLKRDSAELIEQLNQYIRDPQAVLDEESFVCLLSKCKRYEMGWEACATIVKAIAHFAGATKKWTNDLQVTFERFFCSFMNSFLKKYNQGICKLFTMPSVNYVTSTFFSPMILPVMLHYLPF